MIKNSIWSILEMAGNAIISFGLSIFIGRFYGVENLGLYSFVASSSAIAAAISNFGVTPYYIKRIAQSKTRLRYINRLLNIRIFVGVPFYFFISTAIIFFVSGNVLGSDYFILVIYFGLINTNLLLSSIFNSQQRNGEFFIYSLAYKFCSLAGMLFVAFLYKLEFSSYIIFLSVIALSQIYIIVVFKMNSINTKLWARRFVSNIKIIKKTLFIGFGATFEAIMNRIDLLVIGYFLSESSVGIYSAAYTYFMVYILISLAVTKVFFAKFASYWNNSINQATNFLKKYAAVSFLYGLIAMSTLYFTADFFVNFFYGEKFNSSVELIQGLSVCVIPIIFSRIFGHVINAVGGFKFVTYSTCAGAIVALFVNLLFIESHSIWAPIYATFLAETVVCMALIPVFFSIKKSKKAT